MEDVIAFSLIVLAILICISSLDDLAVDAAAFALERPTSSIAVEPLDAQNKRIAIFVANWHEADVLEQMVEANLAALGYRKLRIYLGVYPNDNATRDIALALERRYPDRVRTIINRLPGPTSKGQLLNVMFDEVFGRAKPWPELVVIHDSEDVIDPRSPAVYSAYAAHFDFIQIPVFSLDSRRRSWVAAHYMEEFAERHCREMEIRSALGAVIPSAGVGTCLNRRVIDHFIETRGTVLDNGSVTEDYILGAEVHRAGFRSAFVRLAGEGDAGIIATREYFPKTFWASVRQKSRWVFGICFEGTRKLGWTGNLRDDFFFYRDRKGVVTNLLPPVALVLAGAAFAFEIPTEPESAALRETLIVILVFNGVALVFRAAIKIVSIRRVYGFYDPLGVLVRWPVGVCVNCIATARAWRSFLFESRLASRPITWAKTQHELPDHFVVPGRTAVALLPAPAPALTHTRSSKPIREARSLRIDRPLPFFRHGDL